jgi:CheY-like chemotaxis protein
MAEPCALKGSAKGCGTMHPSNHDSSGKSASARRLLIADDDPAIRALLRNVLEGEGYAIAEAASAVEIFQMLDVHVPDVLLLDVHLGPDDGLAIGAGLRQEPRYDAMKIVFMTGTMDQPELLRLSRQWKVPILGKPFDFDALFEAVA